MKRTTLFLLVIALVALASACGGGTKEVPSNSVAVVGGKDITKAEFDRVMEQAKVGLKNQKRPFPKPGTEEYKVLRDQAMEFLAQRVQFQQKLDEMDIKVNEKDVDKQLADLKKQVFGGDEKKYKQRIAAQGVTDAQVREDVRAQITQNKLYEKVIAEAKVTDVEVKAFYDKNGAQYEQGESREVRHILVKKRSKADTLHKQIQGGASFAALAKKHSEDPSSKPQGGKLTVIKGQFVPQFEKKAFALKNGEVSGPVKTRYGWHLIEALGSTKPGKKTPFAQVKEAIRQQLLQKKQGEAVDKFLADLKKEYEDKTRYQVGYAPTKTTATGTTTS